MRNNKIASSVHSCHILYRIFILSFNEYEISFSSKFDWLTVFYTTFNIEHTCGQHIYNMDGISIREINWLCPPALSDIFPPSHFICLHFFVPLIVWIFMWHVCAIMPFVSFAIYVLGSLHHSSHAHPNACVCVCICVCVHINLVYYGLLKNSFYINSHPFL